MMPEDNIYIRNWPGLLFYSEDFTSDALLVLDGISMSCGLELFNGAEFETVRFCFSAFRNNVISCKKDKSAEVANKHDLYQQFRGNNQQSHSKH